MTSLTEVFGKARAEGRAALVGYLPAGYPSVNGAIRAATAMVESGVDVVEVGWPYSDPLMDGATIQDAVHQALVGGARSADVLRTVEAVAGTGAVAAVMTYWNPIERYGEERFAHDLRAAGGAGVITPDLTPEEAGSWLDATARTGLAPVFLIAPSSTGERIATVTRVTGGFLYAASTMGVTGTRGQVGDRAADLVARARVHTDLPIAVGLGVSDAAQAAEVASFADGVIVGSAFVRRLIDAAARGDSDSAGASDVGALAGELAGGVRERRDHTSPAGA